MWLILSLLTAFFTAFSALMSKKATAYFNRVYLILLVPLLTSAVLLSTSNLVILDSRFFLYLLLSASLSFATSNLQLWAYEHGEISQLFPLVNFTPFFMLLTSPVLLGEYPSAGGIVGVLLIIFGAYILHLESGQTDFLAPLKLVWKSKPSMDMVGVAFLWSLNGAVDKMGILVSNPGIWGGSVKLSVAVLTLAFFPLYVRKKHLKIKKKQFSPSKIHYIILPAVFSVLILLTSFHAYTLTNVAYVISVKRLSSLIVIILSQYMFREKNILQRLTGGVIMLAGVLIISVFT